MKPRTIFILSQPTLTVRRTRLTTVGDRAFPVIRSHLWNSLPHQRHLVNDARHVLLSSKNLLLYAIISLQTVFINTVYSGLAVHTLGHYK